jgi:hypothetical protein
MNKGKRPSQGRRKGTGEMPFLLPDITDHRFLEIDLCGHIIHEQGEDFGVAQEEEGLIASYRSGEKEAYIELVLPYPGEYMHVHLRVAVAEFFDEDDLPTTNCSIQDIQRRLRPFEGRQIAVRTRATYRIRREEFPPFIRSFVFTTGADDIELSMVGATVEVRGRGTPPVDTISWRLQDRGSNAIVRLESRTTTTFDASYLRRCLDAVHATFRGLILRERVDA